MWVERRKGIKNIKKTKKNKRKMKIIKQNPFVNKEIDIKKLKQEYEKLQRLDKKRLSKAR